MREEKKQMVNEVAGQLKDRSAVLISYQGIKANTMNEFRAKVAGEGINGACHVVPNTLLKKAAAQLGYDNLAGIDLNGDTALVSGADPVALVKAIKDFAKENKDKVNIKFGFVEGAVLGSEETAALADLPPKEAVQAQILGLLQAPASGIVRALNAKIASIVYVLKAYADKKEKEETA